MFVSIEILDPHDSTITAVTKITIERAKMISSRLFAVAHSPQMMPHVFELKIIKDISNGHPMTGPSVPKMDTDLLYISSGRK